MKSLGLITLVLIVWSCSINNKSSQVVKSDTLMINNSVYQLYSIGFDEFQAVETEKFNENESEIINDSSVHRLDKLNLRFKLKNGQEITLKSDTTDSNYVTYRFVESLKNIDYWFIRVTYYEGGGFLLIDKQNGEKVEIYGKPYFSKNNNWFVTYSFDIEASYDSNGFQLFQIENGKVKLKWTKDINDWGPSIVKWLNDSSVLIEQSRINSNTNESESRMLLSYRKMTIIK
jgi:hypothetical protein